MRERGYAQEIWRRRILLLATKNKGSSTNSRRVGNGGREEGANDVPPVQNEISELRNISRAKQPSRTKISNERLRLRQGRVHIPRQNSE